MRIIAGGLGGRIITSPNGYRTHPMSDKMRGSLFNALGDISGLAVLDVFSGSGALAIESISRGARSAIALDSDKNAISAVKNNVKKLNLNSKIKPIQVQFSSWSNNNEDNQFDLIFADPPYDNLQTNQLIMLPKHLNDTGLLVLSWPGKMQLWQPKELKVVQNSKYGDSQLVFYSKIR